MNNVCRNVLIKESNFNNIKHIIIDFIGESYIDRLLSISLDPKQIVHKVDISQNKLAKAIENETGFENVKIVMINTIDNIRGRIDCKITHEQDSKTVEDNSQFYFLDYNNEIKDILL